MGLFPQTQSSVQGPLQQPAPSPGSWSTQSLSRSRGGNLAAKLPLRAVNGRISELLQGSAGSRSRGLAQGGGTDPAEERGVGGARLVILHFRHLVAHPKQLKKGQYELSSLHDNEYEAQAVLMQWYNLFTGLTISSYCPALSGGGTVAGGGGDGSGGGGGTGQGEERTAVVQTLPSPYSKITAPRKAHRCSSGHASDNRHDPNFTEKCQHFCCSQFNLKKICILTNCELIVPPTAAY